MPSGLPQHQALKDLVPVKCEARGAWVLALPGAHLRVRNRVRPARAAAGWASSRPRRAAGSIPGLDSSPSSRLEPQGPGGAQQAADLCVTSRGSFPPSPSLSLKTDFKKALSVENGRNRVRRAPCPSGPCEGITGRGPACLRCVTHSLCCFSFRACRDQAAHRREQVQLSTCIHALHPTRTLPGSSPIRTPWRPPL